MATKKAASTKKKAPVAAKATSTKSAKAVAATKTTVKTIKAAPAVATKQTLGQHIETSLQSARLWRSLGAEFIGTFLLVAVIIVSQGSAIAVMFSLVGIVLLIGAISGAHVNPAITVGAWVTRRIGWLRAIAYIFVQFLGAAVAYFALSAFLGGQAAVSAEAAAYGQTAQELFKAVDLTNLTGKEWFVFFAELLGVAILAFAYANASRLQDQISKAFSIGLGIFIALMIAGTAAGFVAANAILNPAVALGLQAFTPEAWPYLVYVLAPVVGGALGFVLYDLLRGKDTLVVK
jgi:aquaporin Z